MSDRCRVKHDLCGWQGHVDEINFAHHSTHYWANDEKTRTYYVACPSCPLLIRLVIQGDETAAIVLESG